MIRNTFLIFLVPILLFSACSYARDDVGRTFAGDNAAVRCDALRAAYIRAKEERIATDGKVVVISDIREFVVVSFIGKKNTYGGGIHLVYSPVSNKVVYSFIEE